MRPLTGEPVRLINEAFEIYRRTHAVPSELKLEVCQDFARFYLEALKRGLRGIRWNFNGCIACPGEQAQVRLRRILLVDPFVTGATAGRGLGTVICAAHEHLLDTVDGMAQTIIPGALRRIAQQPPVSGLVAA